MSTEIPFLSRLGGMLPDAPPNPAPRRRLPALIVGLTAALVVAVSIYTLRPAPESEGVSASSPPQTDAEIIRIDRSKPEDIPADLPRLSVLESSLGRELGPQDVLATDTGVWVVTFQDLYLLDTSGKLVDSLPYRAEDGARLAATGSDIWVFDGLRGLSTVSETGVKEVTEVALADMVGTDTTLWVSRDDGTVGRLDAASAAEVSGTAGGVAGDISRAKGGAWVSGGLIQGDSVFVTTDGRVTLRIPEASHAVEAAGYTWVVSYEAPFDRDEASVVAAVDTATGVTVKTFAIPRAASLATDGKDVWIYALAPSTKKGTWTPDPDVPGQVVRIDGTSLKPLGAAAWGLGPVQMSARDGEMWIADLSTGAVGRVSG